MNLHSNSVFLTIIALIKNPTNICIPVFGNASSIFFHGSSWSHSIKHFILLPVLFNKLSTRFIMPSKHATEHNEVRPGAKRLWNVTWICTATVLQLIVASGAVTQKHWHILKNQEQLECIHVLKWYALPVREQRQHTRLLRSVADNPLLSFFAWYTQILVRFPL